MSSSEFEEDICAACVCVFERVCVEWWSYKDPSVGESDHKPPEQLILSL